jgi:hypothetical protein
MNNEDGMVIRRTPNAMMVVLNSDSRKSGSPNNSRKLSNPTKGLFLERIFH